MTRKSLILLFAVWVVAVGAGFTALTAYKLRPGDQGEVPSAWPADVSIARRDGVPALVMNLHPRCVCSRASLAELNVLRSRFVGELDIHLIFARPEGVAKGWEDTDTWRTAGEIGGAMRRLDEQGGLAERFGAKTSGHVVLFDGAGRVVYSGGLTGGRGHEGDNAGLDRALTALRGETPELGTAPVFGCEIDGENLKGEADVRSNDGRT